MGVISYKELGKIRKMYGKEKINAFFQEKLALKRQFLHAQKIGFKMPTTNKKTVFETVLPEDLEKVLKRLRAHSK